MTRFTIRQKVLSTVNAQGMRWGHSYTITDIETQLSPFGDITTYVLDETLRIINGHLILNECNEQSK